MWDMLELVSKGEADKQGDGGTGVRELSTEWAKQQETGGTMFPPTKLATNAAGQCVLGLESGECAYGERFGGFGGNGKAHVERHGQGGVGWAAWNGRGECGMSVWLGWVCGEVLGGAMMGRGGWGLAGWMRWVVWEGGCTG